MYMNTYIVMVSFNISIIYIIILLYMSPTDFTFCPHNNWVALIVKVTMGRHGR